MADEYGRGWTREQWTRYLTVGSHLESIGENPPDVHIDHLLDCQSCPPPLGTGDGRPECDCAFRIRLREYDTGERLAIDPLSDPVVQEGLRRAMDLPVRVAWFTREDILPYLDRTFPPRRPWWRRLLAWRPWR